MKAYSPKRLIRAYLHPPSPRLILHRIRWFILRRLGVGAAYLSSLDRELSEPRWFVETIKSWSGTFIDVGAGTGDYVLATVARLVYAFEPDPRCRRIIASRAGESGRVVKLYGAALGDRDGEAEFTLARDLKQSTMVMSREGGRARVCVRRLDTVAFSGEGLPVDGKVLVKIDVEGAEHLVLEGASRFIEMYRPTVLVEYHENLREVLKVLKRHGYRVTHYLQDIYSGFERGWLRCVAD